VWWRWGREGGKEGGKEGGREGKGKGGGVVTMRNVHHPRGSLSPSLPPSRPPSLFPALPPAVPPSLPPFQCPGKQRVWVEKSSLEGGREDGGEDGREEGVAPSRVVITSPRAPGSRELVSCGRPDYGREGGREGGGREGGRAMAGLLDVCVGWLETTDARQLSQ